jgi:hypothetical protein
VAREAFIDKKFQPASLKVIEIANNILSEYKAQDLVLTLRQLYYQFVARGLLANKQTEYKRLGGIISDARLAGKIDWAMMEDRTRTLKTQSVWDDPSSIIEAVADQYREDLWAAQTYRPEVWIEKDALLGVIERPCRDVRVPYFACRGYSSQSAQYEASRRFRRYAKAGQKPIILHFGDHDPSGLDMTRDNRERLDTFVGYGKVTVKRLALNMDQVRRYNPPPNPAKESDVRAAGYIAEYGGESWELDALEPRVIGELIRNEVESLKDRDAWAEAEREERENKEDLEFVSNQWNEVREFVRGNRD